MAVAKTSVSVVYVVCVVYIAGMLELLLIIVPLSISLGWWAHIILVGRSVRLHSKVDAARQYWKKKYHEAIAQRNVARGQLTRLKRRNNELKAMEESAHTMLSAQQNKCASGKCRA